MLGLWDLGYCYSQVRQRRYLHENKYSYSWLIGREWNIKCSTFEQTQKLASIDGATFQRHVSSLTALERAYNNGDVRQERPEAAGHCSVLSSGD